MISHRIELSFYLLTGPIILSRLSHGGLQSWLGLHHPAVLGTPSAWGWQHPCPYPSVPGKALSYSTRWSLACPLGWSSCHLQTKALLWCSFDFVARTGGIWGTFPSLFPSLSPFPFPPFHPLPLFFPSFLFPSLLGFVLISCRRGRESATATDLFNKLLLLTKE